MAPKKQDTLTLDIFGVIDPFFGDVSAASIRDQIKAAGDGVKNINMRINSPGGAIFDSLAIHNLLRLHPAKVTATVLGLAASGASIVAMAGDAIEVAAGGFLMLHNPLGIAAGDAEEMRDYAATLDALKTQMVSIYAKRSGRDAATISEMLDAETWLDGPQAVAEGFADRVTAGLSVAASAAFDLTRFKNVPQSLLSPKGTPVMASATYQELRSSFPKADAAFIVSQQEAQATLPQAQAAYQAALENRLAAAEAKAGKGKSEAVGVTVQPEGRLIDGSITDPVSEWHDALAALTGKGLSRARASSKLAAERPELREAFVDAYNEAHSDARSPAGRKGR
jgi:ATP-dependent protease ClpP protease subunit